MTKAHSVWWLLNRMGDWKIFNVAAQLKEKGIYDPDNVEIVSMELPEPSSEPLPDIEEILKLKETPKKVRSQRPPALPAEDRQ